ncbi:hypothetical protein A2U01_0061763, partial [Trifolium medium]|nr:hypothetical protein [Trifolium medium]
LARLARYEGLPNDAFILDLHQEHLSARLVRDVSPSEDSSPVLAGTR